ncbi:c-type cytochrome [Burkholderiaceae bacterium DAT-1]|nr:c-type cytochrome [Burkholderiaceae bacterium DAT-1]
MHLSHRLSYYVLAWALLSPSAEAGTLTPRQTQLLANNCIQCHARPDIGVPIMGKEADWLDRRRVGESAMLLNVVQGVRGMPPLGYCTACNEQDFRAMIRLMANLPDPVVTTPATGGKK